MWYSYAIIRVVPRVERGEFVNVGVIVFAPERAYLAARIAPAEEIAARTPAGVPLDEVNRRLATLVGIAAGNPACGPLASMPPSERFHWLTTPRSTVIQTSPTHVGRTADPEREIERLMDEFVHPVGAS